MISGGMIGVVAHMSIVAQDDWRVTQYVDTIRPQWVCEVEYTKKVVETLTADKIFSLKMVATQVLDQPHTVHILNVNVIFESVEQ